MLELVYFFLSSSKDNDFFLYFFTSLKFTILRHHVRVPLHFSSFSSAYDAVSNHITMSNLYLGTSFLNSDKFCNSRKRFYVYMMTSLFDLVSSEKHFD